MGDYLRRAYDEAERVASRGSSDATQARQDVADEIEEAVKVACDRILPAHYMTEEAYQHLRQRVAELRAENAKLRDAHKALMVATYAELCSDRDAPQCRECSMRRDECECAITEAMELLGLNADGTPVGTVGE